MRCGILSLVGRKYNNNYGAVLQAFALQTFLKKMGIKPEYIDYHPNVKPRSSIIKYRLNKLVKRFRNDGVKVALKSIFEYIQIRVNKQIFRNLEKIRQQKFDNFREKYLSFSEKSYTNIDDLQISMEKLTGYHYHFLLVGSDQVWNPAIVSTNALRAYLLDFKIKVPKISYASSVGHQIPTTLEDYYKKCLKDFDFISVREKQSAQEIEKILGYSPKIVVDPTLLLTSEEWAKIISPPNFQVRRPYIFVYDIYRSKDILDAMEDLKTEYVNYTPIIRLKKLRYRNCSYTYYTEGPSEFLWFVKNSDFVVTSSFHGTAFAIIFKKPFYSILWDKPEKQGQNGRITYLLDELGLSDRYFVDPKEILRRGLDTDIDWNKVHEKLNAMRRDSVKWLLNALENIRERIVQ
ncbi:hypothetical protein Mc24_08374 [Thermotoga sp. Mc24]|uniref:polysaccharide pyruvyl transferase family protein n=1 Tax=Thermotoga sp. Mc24 TaxID=1231241 RepID=UPI00054384B9|nr:polysaccharide pyruvyl transferase family protein [Thermotoga sp. Mc24]KHC90361.1 hypothetical protein Mc24_08374 [Thermotoga sp. Mc24]